MCYNQSHTEMHIDLERSATSKNQYQQEAQLSLTSRGVIGNESVPIQLAQCRFPRLVISNAEISIHFFQQNTQKQFYQTALGNCYRLKLPKC